MTAIGVILGGGLLGLALAIYGHWLAALSLSALSFLVGIAVCLYIGDTVMIALIRSIALASIIQVSYVLSGYFLPEKSAYVARTKGIQSRDNLS